MTDKIRNILLITTDQMRFDALGCNGGRVARMPCIDALAADVESLGRSRIRVSEIRFTSRTKSSTYPFA